MGRRAARRIAVRSTTGWRWVDFVVADPATELEHISCASPSWCLITGTGRDVVAFDGTTVRAMPRTPATVGAVSCPSAVWCAAVSEGAFVEWDGARWSTSALERAGSLTDVDCWAEQRCVAVAEGDGGTSAYVRSPASAWLPTTVPPGRTASDDYGYGTPDLDCSSDGSCHLLRGFGRSRAPELRLASWSAGAWTATTPLPQLDGFVVAVGCRPGECVLADLSLLGGLRPGRHQCAARFRRPVDPPGDGRAAGPAPDHPPARGGVPGSGLVPGPGRHRARQLRHAVGRSGLAGAAARAGGPARRRLLAAGRLRGRGLRRRARPCRPADGGTVAAPAAAVGALDGLEHHHRPELRRAALRLWRVLRGARHRRHGHLRGPAHPGRLAGRADRSDDRGGAHVHGAIRRSTAPRPRSVSASSR